MNHIGAKTEAPNSAWEQLAQTQNFEHPIRQQAPMGGVKQTNNNQTQPIAVAPPPTTPLQQTQQQQSPVQPPNSAQPPAGNPQQQPTDPNKPPEYGEELHPELVSGKLFHTIRFLLHIGKNYITGTTRLEKVLV
jgi:hypothetical protein